MVKMNLIIRISGQDDSGMTFQSGFARYMAGALIDYHSSHPEAEQALLVRTKKGIDRIAWLTDKPRKDKEGKLRFCWLGGLAGCQGGPHIFELWADNRFLLDIASTAKGELPQADFAGPDGVVLNYEHQLTDMCGDHFGLFWLTLPETYYKADGISLELRARDEESEDWAMVFAYPFSGLPHFLPDSLLAKTGFGLRQKLVLGLDSLSPANVMDAELDGKQLLTIALKRGYNRCELDIPTLSEPTELFVQSYFNGILADERPEVLRPVTPRKVYILPYSHNDIGYTDLQDKVESIQIENLDNALRLIAASQGKDFSARAKWNLEVLWILRSWWDQASETSREEFVRAVKEGCIGLNALFANPLTGLCDLAEIQHLFDIAHWFRAISGLGITTATVTDIPGFVWSLLPALAHNGVRYFSIAPNSGDRTGFIYKGLGDKPFWWESPCGTQRVLTWVHGAGYSQFHKEKITANGIRKLMNYLVRLDAAGYPFEIVGLPYTIGGDNGGPDPALADFVEDWNNRYCSPQLIISTHAQMFGELDRLHGAQLPVLRGDMTPYWEDGALSTAAETILARAVAGELTALQTCYALFRREDPDTEDFTEAWKKLMLWDEHTWGAWNSVSDPDLPFVKKQWEIKRSFALQAHELAAQLKAKLQGSPSPLFYAINPLSYGGQRFLRLANGLADGCLVTDSVGEVMPGQRIGSDTLVEMSFENGWQTAKLILKPVCQSGKPQEILFTGSFQNAFFNVRFDDRSGAISSLYDRELGAEVLSPGAGLGALHYVSGGKWREPTSVHFAELICSESGSLCQRIVFRCALSGTHFVLLEYLFYHRAKRIDLNVTVSKIAVRLRESLHLEFPFGLEGGVLRYDSAGAPLRPEFDQLPGMCRNFLSPTSYADVSTSDYGITVALLDTPLIEVGGLTAEQPWLESLHSETRFFAYLMNNIWHTNYKADQEGEATFRYSMLFHAGFEPTQVLSEVLAVRTPLQLLDGKVREPQFPFPPPPLPLVCLALRYLPEQAAYLLLILNSSDHDAQWRLPGTKTYVSDPLGTKADECKEILACKGFQQLWLLVEV